jgi:nitroimidazol reductase NimA-like FMN-containing flavoprotein (pyridoxamine 5'-phosphate oxidase superfamily)
VSGALNGLTRKKDRAADRKVLDEVFDQSLVATLSTVIEGHPWVVPTFVVRVDDELLLHGSTGAGALRHAADGAPVVLSAFILDGLVVAERAFDHSANYRSAVVRGTCTVVDDTQAAALLDAFTDQMLPGRSAECPPHSDREIAATLALRLAIEQDNWVAKQRTGPPSSPTTTHWTGVIPTTTTFLSPVSESPHPPPASVRRLAR